MSKYTKPHHIHASESLGGVKISSRKIKVDRIHWEWSSYSYVWWTPGDSDFFFKNFWVCMGWLAGTLAPQPRMEPRPLAVRTWVHRDHQGIPPVTYFNISSWKLFLPFPSPFPFSLSSKIKEKRKKHPNKHSDGPSHYFVPIRRSWLRNSHLNDEKENKTGKPIVALRELSY